MMTDLSLNWARIYIPGSNIRGFGGQVQLFLLTPTPQPVRQSFHIHYTFDALIFSPAKLQLPEAAYMILYAA